MSGVADLINLLTRTTLYGVACDIEPAPVKPAEPTPFTAWVDCPKCGTIACHWLDKPRRVTQQQLDDYARLMEARANKPDVVKVWTGEAVQTLSDRYTPPPPRDEIFPVARICVKCNHRWGQK